MKNALRTPGLRNKYASMENLAADLLKYVKRMEDEKKITKTVQIIAIPSSSKSKHILIYDYDFMNAFNTENDMFIDATFRIRPKVRGLQQVLTIMLRKHNTVTISCIYYYNDTKNSFFFLIFILCIFSYSCCAFYYIHYTSS